MRILIVEDNPGDVHLTNAALRDAKVAHEAYVVTDGEEALAYLNRRAPYANAPEPDVIFLDLNIPKINGHQVLATIKRDPRLRHIPVVVVSGSRGAEDIRRAYDEQASMYLPKSADLDEYFGAIRALKELLFHHVALPPHVVNPQ